MLSPIFESLLNGENHRRYERYDGVNQILIISTSDHEIKVTPEMMKLDSVEYSMQLMYPHHGIPINRNNVFIIDYDTFLDSDSNDVFGITKHDIQSVLDYYRSLG